MKKYDEKSNPEGDKTEEIFSTTVQCPWHNLPLTIETENKEVEGKTVFVQFAICRCRVPDNAHFGSRVWEKS